MRLKESFYVVILILGLLLAACSDPAAEQTPPATVEVEIEPTATAVPPTDTPEPEPTPTATPATEATTEIEEATGQELEQATIVNDEGGPVSITGVVTYTNPFFTLGVAEPVVILEDQAGFVDRDEGFLMPVESQTLGQITSDFYTSPFSYSISLPIEPQGTLRDVDNDGEEDTGVQVFAVAYWNNTFGDPFLEERDLSGGGWSTAYASTRVSDDADTEREIIGGQFLVYAPDDEQGFPSGFGEDGLLFTEDDPIVAIPQGYSVVNMDVDPFTFDRAEDQVIDLIEPESAALVDYSDLSYPEAFDSLVELLSNEYAFTEYKGIDWDALHEEFRPRFEEAEDENDSQLYLTALRDFAWSIPDGHVSGPLLIDEFRQQTSGGLGIAIRELDDGRVIVNFLLEGSPADQAGMELGTEIVSINDTPIQEAISDTVAYSAPFSTEHFRRLQQMRYVTRFPLDTEVDVTFVNPDSNTQQTATLTAVSEQASFSFSSFNVGRTGFELPVEYELLEDSGLGYVKVYSFSDNDLLTIQLWERMIRTLKENDVPGLIVDLRQNGGGRGFLADQMAAYFFDEELDLGNTGFYDEDRGEFYFDPDREQQFYLPEEEFRYDGDLAVVIGPNCNSACEFFAYDLTLQDRSTVVGHYPTAGLGGSVDRVLMPENEFFQFTQGRAVDPEGNIHIEGKGVPPDIEVPVNEETLLGEGDPLLDAAVAHLGGSAEFEIIDGGAIELGDEVTDELQAGQRVRYAVDLSGGDIIDVSLESDDVDTILGLYDEDGNLLGTTEGAESTIEELEIPFDLVLILEVSSADDAGQGEYTLRVTESEG